MIGAHALTENITQVTNTTREYKPIENLSFEAYTLIYAIMYPAYSLRSDKLVLRTSTSLFRSILAYS